MQEVSAVESMDYCRVTWILRGLCRKKMRRVK
jgi:hypothetical protein